MAALIGKRVVAGALGVSAILGLCSCSNNTSATGTMSPGPTTSVEQTIDTTVAPTSTPTEAPPADAADYVFSEQPQGATEQAIFDTYPDLWEQGIREVTTERMTMSYDLSHQIPSALVQYIDGVRYAGSERYPLGFRGQTDAPGAFPTDAFAGTLASFSGTIPPGANVGLGGYRVAIFTDPLYGRDPENPRAGNAKIEIDYRGADRASISVFSVRGTFASNEEAWAHVQSGIETPDGRVLNRGEMAIITKSGPISTEGDGGYKTELYDPASGTWVPTR